MGDQQAITCIVENGNIFKLEFGQKICIGVTAEVFTDLKNSAEKAITRNDELATEKDKYYNMLIEHGIITKPKSTEDRVLELEQTNSKILLFLEKINSRLDANDKKLGVLEDGPTNNIKNGKSSRDRAGQDTTSITVVN